MLVDALGWDMDHFGLVTELKSAEQSSALCDNTIDAFLMVAGNPVANVLEAATTCDINIIAVEGDKVNTLIDSKPYYGKVTIPGGLYRGVDEDVPSFGLPSTFVTTTKVPEETVYVMVKAVFDNFDTFKTFHPAFRQPQEGRDGGERSLGPDASWCRKVLPRGRPYRIGSLPRGGGPGCCPKFQ